MHHPLRLRRDEARHGPGLGGHSPLRRSCWRSPTPGGSTARAALAKLADAARSKRDHRPAGTGCSRSAAREAPGMCFSLTQRHQPSSLSARGPADRRGWAAIKEACCSSAVVDDLRMHGGVVIAGLSAGAVAVRIALVGYRTSSAR